MVNANNHLPMSRDSSRGLALPRPQWLGLLYLSARGARLRAARGRSISPAPNVCMCASPHSNKSLSEQNDRSLAKADANAVWARPALVAHWTQRVATHSPAAGATRAQGLLTPLATVGRADPLP